MIPSRRHRQEALPIDAGIRGENDEVFSEYDSESDEEQEHAGVNVEGQQDLRQPTNAQVQHDSDFESNYDSDYSHDHNADEVKTHSKSSGILRWIVGMIASIITILISDFRILKSSSGYSKSSKDVDHDHKDIVAIPKVTMFRLICSLFRLSVVAFLLLLGMLQVTDLGSAGNGSGSSFSFSSRFRRRKAVKNFWEDYDPIWNDAETLPWRDIRPHVHKYDFDFLLPNISLSTLSSEQLETLENKDEGFKLWKKMKKIYMNTAPNNKKTIFHTLNNYNAIKSNDLIQIKRPAVRTKRADEPRATRTFGCMRDGCRGLAIEDLLDRGWQMRFRNAVVNETWKNINYRVTFLMTDTTHLNIMQKNRPDLFQKIYHEYMGKVYLEAFDGGDAIGGNKGQQIMVKEKYVKNFGCKFNDLNIAPKSYRLYKQDECEDLMDKMGDKSLSWILKPETGSQGTGITFHDEVSSVIAKVPQFFPCKESDAKLKATERYLVQQYLSKPLLLKKSKFDVRVYMLIASSNPYLVFYHEGYLRRSLAEYSPDSKDRRVYLTNTHFQSMKKGFKLSDHIWPFWMMQEHLSTHMRTGGHYVETILNPYIKKVANFIFQTAREKLVKRKGTFHVFGIDFMVDADYHVWFIEANGYPGFTWSLNFDTRSMVEEMFNLVQQVHENPRFYMLMSPGDRYGGFEMIYNEMDEERARKQKVPANSLTLPTPGSNVNSMLEKFQFPNIRGNYNPCLEFKQNLAYTQPLRKSNLKLAKISGKDGKIDKFKNFMCVIPNIPSDASGKQLALSTKSPNHVNAKSWIIKAEKEYLNSYGCRREKLRYAPTTYILTDPQDCKEFFKDSKSVTFDQFAGEEPSTKRSAIGAWVVKTPNGVQLYMSKDEIAPLYGSCSLSSSLPKDEVLVQKFVENRMLFKNKWWDMKVYFLIASTEPFMVFYRTGFLRTSKIHVNQALKESAELLAQQIRTQKQQQKAADKQAKEADSISPEIDGSDDGNVENEEDSWRSEFTTEELLKDLEDELGFDVSRIINPNGISNSDSEEDNDEASPEITGSINVAGLQLNLNKNNPQGAASLVMDEMSPLNIDLATGVLEEPWAPDEYLTGSVWQVGEDFWSFEDFQDKMAKEMLIGSQYVDSVFDVYVKKVLNMVTRSIMAQKNRSAHSYELYEANFFLDEHFVIHYVDSKVIDPEATFPNVDEEMLTNDRNKFQKELAEVVLELSTSPIAFSRMLKGDSYGKWRVIFSEFEEIQRGQYSLKYDPCDEFKRNQMVHKGSIYKNAWLHNYAEKRHAANKRELNKYIQNKWTTCKYKPSKELMSSCIRNTISYHYKIYIQKEAIEYQEGYVENRIRDLIAKRESEKGSGGGGGSSEGSVD